MTANSPPENKILQEISLENVFASIPQSPKLLRSTSLRTPTSYHEHSFHHYSPKSTPSSPISTPSFPSYPATASSSSSSSSSSSTVQLIRSRSKHDHKNNELELKNENSGWGSSFSDGENPQPQLLKSVDSSSLSRKEKFIRIIGTLYPNFTLQRDDVSF